MTTLSYLLPISDTISAAWHKVSGAKATIWLAYLITVITLFGIKLLAASLYVILPDSIFVMYFIYGFLSFLFTMGIVYIGIKRAQELPISFEMVFHAFKAKIAFKLIGFYILVFLILLIPAIVTAASIQMIANDSMTTNFLGYILYFIGVFATIYLTIRLALGVGFVLDKESNPLQAVKLSFHATRGNFWRIFLVHFLLSLVLVISAIPLLIGLIWTLPLVIICYGFIYKNLSTQNI